MNLKLIIIALTSFPEILSPVALKFTKLLGQVCWNPLIKSAWRMNLIKNNYTIRTEWPIPLIYKEVKMECGYRADIVVENKIILEIKSVEPLTDIHTAQVLTYLKLSGCRLALLINFNVLRVKDGIRRLVNNF
jgi:GxxExxY protein